MKLNNKGFAISTILYGLLALLILIIMLIFQVMRTNNNNNKELSESINNELKLCREERIKYNSCYDENPSSSVFVNPSSSCYEADKDYNNCLSAEGLTS